MSGNYRNYILRYTAGYTKDHGMLVPDIRSNKIVMNHTKRYHNCLYKLAGLNPCTRDLMDFITENMGDKNEVTHNVGFRDKFIAFIEEVTNGEVTYGHPAIKKSFKKLTDKNMLIPEEYRGEFQVNPKFFIRNDDKERINMIKLLLEFKKGKDTSMSAEFIEKELSGKNS